MSNYKAFWDQVLFAGKKAYANYYILIEQISVKKKKNEFQPAFEREPGNWVCLTINEIPVILLGFKY